MDVIVSDSWHDHDANRSADKLMTGCNIGDGDKTCLEKLGLAETTRHRHFKLSLNHPLQPPQMLRVRLATVSYKCFCTKKFSPINLDVLELVIKKSVYYY